MGWVLRSGLQARSGHGKGRPHDADLFEAWAEVVLAVGLGQLSGSPALVGAREVVMDPHPSCSEVLAVIEEAHQRAAEPREIFLRPFWGKKAKKCIPCTAGARTHAL